MAKTYIELSSTYRNRLEYPNPANFVVNPCELNNENFCENSNITSSAYPFYNFWSLPLNIIKRYTDVKQPDGSDGADGTDDNLYKPLLLPMNFGLSTTSLKKKFNENATPINSNLSDCTEIDLINTNIGTQEEPIFTNVLRPIHTLTNLYDYKEEYDTSCETTSMYNIYVKTGLIGNISKQPHIQNYFNGMYINNFNTMDNCKESSMVVESDIDSRVPFNKCAELIIPNRMSIGTSEEIYYKIDFDKNLFNMQNKILYKTNQRRPPIGNVESTYSSIDSLKFNVSPSFSNIFKCFCWEDVKNVECKKANYNPYIYNNIDWNSIRIHGGVNDNQGYTSTYVEFIPVPISAKLNFSKALPNGLSDRFKMISNYNATTKLASFTNCEDEINNTSRQWQRMIYWMLYARCGRGLRSEIPYNPSEICNENLLNVIANHNRENSNNGSDGFCDWKKLKCSDVLKFKKSELTNKTEAELNKLCLSATIPSVPFPSVNVNLSYNDIINGSFYTLMQTNLNHELNQTNKPSTYGNPTHFKENNVWKLFTIWSSGSKNITALAWELTSNPITSTPANDAFQLFSAISIPPTHYLDPHTCNYVVWNDTVPEEYVELLGVGWGSFKMEYSNECSVDYSVPCEGTNYIWNFRMRHDIPEMIATTNTGPIEYTLNYTNPNDPSQKFIQTPDYCETTPPLYLFGVPYDIEILDGGSGYTRGGYFIYGVDNCDLLEIEYSVSCGEVTHVKLTKLALDSMIYEKLSNVKGNILSASGILKYQTKTSECEIQNTKQYFNSMFPDYLEMNCINSDSNDYGPYTYNWDGRDNNMRTKTLWFGGSGASIRISKGFGFFSNLGYYDQTNYAYKSCNSNIGPSDNDRKEHLLFIPSVVENHNNNFCENINSLNFSSVCQTKDKHHGVQSSDEETFNFKWQYNSKMDFYRNYPVYMNKEALCKNKYMDPPYDSTTTGTTPILANFSTNDIKIYWTKDLRSIQNKPLEWKYCRFNNIEPQTQLISFCPPVAPAVNPSYVVVQHVVDASVFITKQAFPGYPKVIEGLWDITADETPDLSWEKNTNSVTEEKQIPTQCCAYEWEILKVDKPSYMSMNNQLVSKASQQEPGNYNISLRNLIIPNLRLQTGWRTPDYSHFYVELSNQSGTSKQKQMIQSNNPNSSSALFRTTITDSSHPNSTKFLKLSGDGMSQSVKFNTLESMKLRIYLPDGKEFMTRDCDNAPPFQSNPLLQVTALFELSDV